VTQRLGLVKRLVPRSAWLGDEVEHKVAEVEYWAFFYSVAFCPQGGPVFAAGAAAVFPEE